MSATAEGPRRRYSSGHNTFISRNNAVGKEKDILPRGVMRTPIVFYAKGRGNGIPGILLEVANIRNLGIG